MRLKERLSRLLPTPVKKGLVVRKEKGTLQRTPTVECHPKHLKPIDEVALKNLLVFPGMETEWENARKHLHSLNIPDMTGGVNPGDRRAIYSLIRRLKPRSVLEVGTHIGLSTLQIALALSANQMEDGKSAKVVSVDIMDVNDPVAKPWLEYGMTLSPAEILEKMKLKQHVEFVKNRSLSFLEKSERQFDFIFLDGDHSAKTVYKEVPAALRALENNGVVLLHDYFPNLEPLWSNGVVIPGPFLAMERLKAEGAKLAVLPLGELPWPTKLQSNVTSLALLLGNGRQG